MLNKSDLKRALSKDVAVSSKMEAAISLWSAMYEDTPPWLGKEESSLNLPSAIASEHARLTTIEFESEITGSTRADYLNEQYKKVKQALRTNVEFACAKGGLVFKPYINGDKISVDFVHADRFFPTAFDSAGNITGSIFIEQKTVGRTIYTRLEYHSLENDSYTITNKAFSSQSEAILGNETSLQLIDGWADIAPQATFTGVERTLFAYLKMPFANSIDSASPLGVSSYAKAVNLIKEADRQYNRILWEYEGSELAVDADITAVKQREGSAYKFELPKRKERLFRGLDTNKGDFYKIFSPTIRDSSLFNGLNRLLQRIEFNCGLAYGTLSDPQTVDKTAEEIKASKQRSYATVCDIQDALKTALENLVYAMDAWATIGKLAPAGAYEISFNFDDSIVSDRTSEFAEKMQLVTTGIMAKWQMYAWYFGVDEETAKKMVDANVAIDSLFPPDSGGGTGA